MSELQFQWWVGLGGGAAVEQLQFLTYKISYEKNIICLITPELQF